MKAGICLSIAVATVTFVAADAAAQTTPAPAQQQAPQQSPPPASDVVGPSELRDFSLGGDGSTRAPTPDTGQADAPATPAPQPRPTPSQVAPAPTRSGGEAVSTAAPVPEAVTPSSGGAAATAAPADIAPSILPPVAQPSMGPAPEGSPAPAPPSQGISLWPWLLALSVLLIGAVALFVRQRGRRTLAPVGADPRESPQLRVPDPQPAPAAVPVPAAAAAAPRLATGIVSTRLRPWIDLEFLPSRCVFDQERATVEFVVKVMNTGNTDARDVLVETMLFNAGPDQDQEIGAFFAQPFAKGEAIPALPPNSGMELRSSVGLPVDRLRILEAGGRRFFVPLIGFTSIYRWGGGSGQTSRSYLLGREGQGTRMAPFRVDLGPRVFRGLGARDHDVQVRR